MDNNPFRNNQVQAPNGNYGYMSPAGQQQQPYNYPSSQSTPQTNYPQQQQQSWQYQQQPILPQQTSSFSNYPLQSQMSTTSSFSTLPSSQYSSYNTGLMSSNTPTSPLHNNASYGNTPYGATNSMSTMPMLNNYPTNAANNMYYPPPTPQQQQQQQQQLQSNFYIPPNFGVSNSNTYQPRHPPVDATSLLKGTQIRRVECPVCQKMLEGDDMAINHHVNQHYT
ncbi:uncharacterized protein B0P05DRAFT_587741 [Gilbertella persicaria]|uniref:uncharacterized protein n=1 Tax=Gilbertella persicaria TaxID=101096 RepID=UPI00222034CE|nr:uncharacterized protein B0P05DRAFT_587741 [Gilbertella persicaria]KAI8077269.1 hypothetical protein B0P05DRAFT_587741 [Gilbertella persicaria]